MRSLCLVVSWLRFSWHCCPCVVPFQASITRPPASLITGSCGSVPRRSIATIRRLRLPLFISWTRFPSSVDTLVGCHDFCFAPYAAHGENKDVDKPVSPIPVVHQGNRRLSHLPSKPPYCSALLFDPGRTVRTRPVAIKAIRCVRIVPALLNTKTPPIIAISRLYHTALQIAVYASCRHLYRRRKTRFRWLVRPYRTGVLTRRVCIEFFHRWFLSLHFICLSLLLFQRLPNSLSLDGAIGGSLLAISVFSIFPFSHRPRGKTTGNNKFKI